MNTPFIILSLIFLAALLIGANKHGKPKEGNHNFWIDLLGVAIQGGLTYWAIIS